MNFIDALVAARRGGGSRIMVRSTMSDQPAEILHMFSIWNTYVFYIENICETYIFLAVLILSAGAGRRPESRCLPIRAEGAGQ